MDFQGMKDAIANGGSVIIDVRNAGELASSGKIPTAQNVPLPEMGDALQLDEAAFKDKYGFEKPAKEAAIIVHCLKGGRAANAKQAMDGAGYTNVKVYSGSFTDWQANGGDIEKV